MPITDPLVRFWKFVEKTESGCWIWTGKRDKGYGKFWYQGQNVTASRFSYEQFVGPIPEGHHVLHRCDNPPCIRPEHLFTGTQGDNVKDAMQKGRWAYSYGTSLGEAHGLSKLTNEQVREIRKLYQPGHAPHRSPTSARSLAKVFHVSKSTILMIVKRRGWTHLDDSVTV